MQAYAAFMDMLLVDHICDADACRPGPAGAKAVGDAFFDAALYIGPASESLYSYRTHNGKPRQPLVAADGHFPLPEGALPWDRAEVQAKCKECVGPRYYRVFVDDEEVPGSIDEGEVVVVPRALVDGARRPGRGRQHESMTSVRRNIGATAAFRQK